MNVSQRLSIFISVIIFLGVFVGLNARAAEITGNCSLLPKPQIVHPASGSQIIKESSAGGAVAISIYIDPVPILSMEVYATAAATGQASFIGTATKSRGGPNYDTIWQTGGYVNGVYSLQAKAQIFCSPDVITTNSGPVQVTLSTNPNQPLAPSSSNSNPSPTPKPATTENPSPSPQSEPSSSSLENTTAPEPIGTVINPQGEITQQMVDQNTIKISAIDPKTLIPHLKADSIFTEDNLSGSELLGAITFTGDLNKNTRLEKIENRRGQNKQKFLLFMGHTKPSSRVSLSINSEEPIVINTTSDTAGNWTYTFEKPLEPGKHKVVIEVGEDPAKETAGPYFFSIARAQASADNPTGASLDLVTPGKLIKIYLLIAGAAILIGIAIIILIRLRKKDIFTPNAPEKAS